MQSTFSSFPYVVRLACSLLCVTLITYWLYLLAPIVIPILFAILFSILLSGPVAWLEKRGWGRVLATSSVLVVFIVGLGVLFFLIFYQISDFAKMLPQLSQKMNTAVGELQQWTATRFKVSPSRQMAELQKYGQDALKNGGSMLTTVVGTTTNLLGDLVLMPLYIFFMLYYRDMFKQFFYKIFYNVKRTKINSVLNQIQEAVHGYLSGMGIVTLIVGTLNSIGLLALGIDSAIFFGFLAALLLIIPYVGLLIGGLLPLVVALITKDSPMYAAGVVGVFFVVQMLEGNFITPYVVGSKISVNPLAAIVGLLLGSALWGISGMILALPLLAILKVIFDAVASLQPYGYLLGEPEVTKQRAVQGAKMRKMKQEVVETIKDMGEDLKLKRLIKS